MAELERLSLRSEQGSDASSSPTRPEDLVQDEQNVYQVIFRSESLKDDIIYNYVIKQSNKTIRSNFKIYPLSDFQISIWSFI